MTPLFSEILEEVAKAKTKSKKIAILKKHDTMSLRMVIKSSFDPNIKWQLPEGNVPYIPNDSPAGEEHMILLHEAKKLHHYIERGNPNLQQTRREIMFVQLLESLHHSEATLLVACKDKKLHQVYKGLSANVVKEAFNWNDNFMSNNPAPPPTRYPQARGTASGL